MKTNAMRILDKEKIDYKIHEYVNTDLVKGVLVANYLNEDLNHVFKTLVTVGKSIEMIKQKDLLTLTGYVHGGCSPLGMKKNFKTIFDSSAEKIDSIIFSGGKIGYQIETSFKEIKDRFKFDTADIIKDKE